MVFIYQRKKNRKKHRTSIHTYRKQEHKKNLCAAAAVKYFTCKLKTLKLIISVTIQQMFPRFFSVLIHYLFVESEWSHWRSHMNKMGRVTRKQQSTANQSGIHRNSWTRNCTPCKRERKHVTTVERTSSSSSSCDAMQRMGMGDAEISVIILESDDKVDDNATKKRNGE